MSKKDFIVLKNVKKIYNTNENKYVALDDINLNINQGEFVVILGPSGAGKSTLLNIIGGMDSVSSGEILIDGVDISKYNNKELTKYRANNIGFIFQFYNIMPTLTVKENILLVKDVTKTSVNADEALKAVGLYNHRDKFPGELSGGEQQRVAIARAIMKNPKILLCDEPTGALDSKTGKDVLKLLKKETNNDTTVIVVTHNDLISNIADRIIKVKNGKIVSNTINKNIKTVDEVNW